jgi:hypothetical protein
MMSSNSPPPDRYDLAGPGLTGSGDSPRRAADIGRIQLRIGGQLRRQLRIRAAHTGSSVNQLAIRYLTEGLERDHASITQDDEEAES